MSGSRRHVGPSIGTFWGATHEANQTYTVKVHKHILTHCSNTRCASS